MNHVAINQMFQRAERAKSDSDFTYFFALLLAAEALVKTTVIGMVSAIDDDPNRNRYRLEHALVKSDGMGDWGRVLEDALSGAASQFLTPDARNEQTQLTINAKAGEWQYNAVLELKMALNALNIESEDVPAKSDFKRWFRLFSTLRNKTRAHGATQPQKARIAAELLANSIKIFYNNFSLFNRPWAYLYRNLSGRWRISAIAGEITGNEVADNPTSSFTDGIYIFIGKPRKIKLIESTPELLDFYYANGGFKNKTYEMLSYYTDSKITGDATAFATPPSALPASDTEGKGDLIINGNCFTNAPDPIGEYISRPTLEKQLENLLLDDRRPIVTLVGRGGIGKTSLALKVIQSLYSKTRYTTIIWLSSRDVDLHLSGPKPVRPNVLSPHDMGKLYSNLVLSKTSIEKKDFNPQSYFESQLQKCETGPCLFIFDNFETTQNPIELFNWIDTFIRLPNKALITTRLRDFKGDYPIEVQGMEQSEAIELIKTTASSLKSSSVATPLFIENAIKASGGHPYIMKILVGEAIFGSKCGNIVANSDDILTALFERTYAALTPCAKRAFLTLASWNSPTPRIAIEAILINSTEERHEVETGVESLIQYSLAELTPHEGGDLISLPLTASSFGKKKFNISPMKVAIISDVEILQMIGNKSGKSMQKIDNIIERFISAVALKIENGYPYAKYAPIIEMICRAHPTGWVPLIRFHIEQDTPADYEKAKEISRRLLESEIDDETATNAWRTLAYACHKTGDSLGEIHAFIERSKIDTVPFRDLSNTVTRFNQILRDNNLHILDKPQRTAMAKEFLDQIDLRIHEAEPDDLTSIAWLSVNAGDKPRAKKYIQSALKIDPTHYYGNKMMQQLS